jgi:hypothetical protein
VWACGRHSLLEYTSYTQAVNRRKVGGRERRANERPVRRCGFVSASASHQRQGHITSSNDNINSHLDHHAPISPPRSHPLSVIYAPSLTPRYCPARHKCHPQVSQSNSRSLGLSADPKDIKRHRRSQYRLSPSCSVGDATCHATAASPRGWIGLSDCLASLKFRLFTACFSACHPVALKVPFISARKPQIVNQIVAMVRHAQPAASFGVCCMDAQFGDGDECLL